MKGKLFFISAALIIIFNFPQQKVSAQDANRTLSNLLTPTAINVDLRPGTSGTRNLGSGTNAWNNLYVTGEVWFDNSAFLRNKGTQNAYVGHSSGQATTTGSQNAAVGYQTLFKNAIGSNCTAAGAYALYNSNGGNSNTAVGSHSLYANTTGRHNTAVGASALISNTTANYNTGVGANAGVNRTTNSTFLGANAYSLTDLINCTAIGYGAFGTASNQVRIGNGFVTSIGGKVGWTTFSDGRYKKNIKEDVPGLEFINQLKPVTYSLNIDAMDKEMRSHRPGQFLDDLSAEELASNEARRKIIYTGFVAQEVEATAKKLNYDFSGVDAPKNDNDYYGLRYAEFVVPLVKAVQELSKEVQELNQKNQELEESIKLLKSLLTDKKPNFSYGRLEQNAPNPFLTTTIIRYFIPIQANSSKVVITNMKGQVIKSYDVINKGPGEIRLNGGVLTAGAYNYTLWINGKKQDTKQMLLTR